MQQEQRERDETIQRASALKEHHTKCLEKVNRLLDQYDRKTIEAKIEVLVAQNTQLEHKVLESSLRSRCKDSISSFVYFIRNVLRRFIWSIFVSVLMVVLFSVVWKVAEQAAPDTSNHFKNTVMSFFVTLGAYMLELWTIWSAFLDVTIVGTLFNSSTLCDLYW